MLAGCIGAAQSIHLRSQGLDSCGLAPSYENAKTSSFADSKKTAFSAETKKQEPPAPVSFASDAQIAAEEAAMQDRILYEMRQNLQKLKEYGKEIGIEWATSVWDVTSAKEMIQIPCDFLKVPSACNNHFPMLTFLRDEYAGDVHISTGMTTKEEIEEVVKFFEDGKNGNQAKTRLVMYNCTSGYPVPFPDVCMLEINRLNELYANRIKEIAFSGHHLGIAIDIAAYTLGAKWIERHFTKDRTWKGTDHAASLEPAGLGKMCRDLVATHEALTLKPSDILEIETEQRNKLKYRKQ